MLMPKTRYEDYLRTAEQLQRELRWKIAPIAIGLLVVALLFACGSINSHTWGPAVVGLVIYFGGLIFSSIAAQNHEKAKLAEISEAKPAFPQFYKTWKKEKNREALMTGLAIAGVIVAGTLAGAVSAAAEDAKREERVREIEEGVRRAIR
jgi:hypothetical protein